MRRVAVRQIPNRAPTHRPRAFRTSHAATVPPSGRRIAMLDRRTPWGTMTTIAATFRALGGTAASVGTSGGHSVVVDRPVGAAGGEGLGFNGGQLLALAIGGCLCNDLRYAAADAGVAAGTFGLSVDVDVEGGRVVAIRAVVEDANDHDALRTLLEVAVSRSTIVDVVRRGAPLSVRLESTTDRGR